ncbi:hypothetical protein EVA_15982 [gut metagenome]|uniref:Uncharacterized protein n=1 Tax=gut metagenome TaxID=749906 RepID=J9FLW7_9ZZZZ
MERSTCCLFTLTFQRSWKDCPILILFIILLLNLITSSLFGSIARFPQPVEIG